MNNFKIYTRGVIFDEKRDNVLLLKKNNSQKIASAQWVLPGGTVEYGEDVEYSLIREIKEETNLDVQSIQVLNYKKMMIQDTHWFGVYYLVNIKSFDTLKNAEPQKHETVKFVPLKDVPNLKDYTILQFLKTIDSNKEVFDIPHIENKNHAMGTALDMYVDMKIHSFIKNNDSLFSRVRIIGNHDRSTHVSVDEKRNKLFNFERPTVFLDSDILYVSCFPGHDYLYHYASILQYYFDSHKKQKLISYFDTSTKLIDMSFKKTNLEDIPDADIIIFGNVDKLHIFEDAPFNGNGDFMWKLDRIGSKKVMLLGCKFSIWGNLGGHFIHNLNKTINFSTFIYIGKLGSLNESIVPNSYLATGTQSWINNRKITWKNFFTKNVLQKHTVLEGVHITCKSVMDETCDKINDFKSRGDFIDPEIGNMAQACNECEKQFSYLHIISDNVAKKHDQNLSNERQTEIIEKRKKLFTVISDVIMEMIKNL